MTGETPRVCPCGAPLAPPGAGRPPIYCSTTCRRRGENPRRRHLRALAIAERRVDRCEDQAIDHPSECTRLELHLARAALQHLMHDTTAATSAASDEK